MHGTFYNTGGTLSPGGVFGTPGETTVSGNYVQSGGALAIAIGGATRGSGFETGQYDYLNVTSAATVGGALNVGLINGYVPVTGATFSVVTAASPISGSFSNLPSGSYLTMPGNVALFSVAYGSGTAAPDNVTLTTIVGSNASIWNSAAGGSWGTGTNWSANTVPSGSGSVAFFGTALTNSDTVSLTGPTTVGIVSFLNTAAGYTVGPGTGYTLTFNNGGSDAQINDFGGTHAIRAPIAVAGNNNLDVVVTSATDSLALNGSINASGAITMSGAGTLILGGSNNYTASTTLNAGTIVLANSAAASPNSAWTVNVNNGLLFGDGVTAAALGSLSSGGNITLTSSDGLAVTLSVGGNGQNSTFNGTLSGSGGLTKVGNDSMTITNGGPVH